MNLRYLSIGCFSMIGLMLLCGLAGFFCDSHPDVASWIGAGILVLVVLIISVSLVFVILFWQFRQLFHKYPQPQVTHKFPNLWSQMNKGK